MPFRELGTAGGPYLAPYRPPVRDQCPTGGNQVALGRDHEGSDNERLRGRHCPRAGPVEQIGAEQPEIVRGERANGE